MSSVVGISLLVFGVLSGLSDYHISYKVLHLTIASVYLLLTPLIIYVHTKRFYNKGAYDWIAWMHFILFSFILYITVKMLKRWLPKRDTEKHEHFTENYVVKNNGNSYELSGWLNKHPGGKSNVMKIFYEKHSGKDLSEIWDDEGVGWHNSNSSVSSALEEYKM